MHRTGQSRSLCLSIPLFVLACGGFGAVTASAQANPAAPLQPSAASNPAETVRPLTATPIDVVTWHYHTSRTGLNASEAILNWSNVKSSTFGFLRKLPTDGQVHGQPLLLSNLTVNGATHNVVFAVTENDSVYAFDANTGAQLWKKSVLGSGETPSGDHGCTQIAPSIGITSTPVIDRNNGPNGTIFVVAMSRTSGGTFYQRLHALDVTTGDELSGSPMEIQATYPGTGAGSSGGVVTFDPSQYAERSGLLLMGGEIYMGWTSHCDQDPYTGWIMAYNEKTLAQTSVLDVTPNGSEGSIWMAGAGLAADPQGFIYFLDANGTFDTTLGPKGFPAQKDYGNGFVKVGRGGGKLAVADYFEADNTVSESNEDEDLGSGGAMVLPDFKDSSGGVHQLAIGAGKDGNIYVVDRTNMGKFNPNNNNGAYQVLSGGSGGVWSAPAYFNNAVYYGAVGDFIKAYPITNARFAASPSVETANSFVYPGAMPSVSANGVDNGIVWAVENSSPAVLYAYRADTLVELYDSNQAANNRDHFGNGNKFITPMVANGQVYVGMPTGVAVFGLLP